MLVINFSFTQIKFAGKIIYRKPLITKSTTESNCITLNEDVVERSACSRFYYNCTAGELFQLQ